MDLAIATVSFNTRDLLADCLASVLAGLEQSRLAGQVWVVDNASADGSADMVRELFPAVHLVAHPENTGFAAGNNLALARMSDHGARPRHVLFLNPDTRVVGDALGEMVRFLDATPLAGAAGARLVHADGSFQHSAFAFPGLAQVFLDLVPVHHRLLNSRLNGRYPLRLYEGGRPFAVDHPLGAALMVRSRVLDQVGAFDDRYFMYCEEIDLCRRIKAGGWRIYCVPRAQIVHHAAASTRQFRDRMFVALWRSRFLMFKRHNSPAFCRAARLVVWMGLGLAARRAQAAYRRGDMTAAELEGRLRAYREVLAL